MVSEGSVANSCSSPDMRPTDISLMFKGGFLPTFATDWSVLIGFQGCTHSSNETGCLWLINITVTLSMSHLSYWLAASPSMGNRT